MAIKQRPDSPTNNFATLNPLFRNSTLISDGNLKFNKSTVGWATSLANLNLNDGGKYYFEGMATLVGGSNSGIFIGLSKQSATQDNYQQSGIWSFGGTGSTLKIYDETTLVTPSGSSAANDIFKVCFDSSSGYLWFGKNADWYNSSGGTTGDPSNNTNPTITISSSDALFPIVIAYANAIIFNFGQDPTFGGNKTPSGGTNSDGSYPDKSATGIGGFFYDPPAGALALCSANLPEMTPDVDDDVPQDYFKAVTYTGKNADSTFIDNGDNTWSKTDVGFQPDFVWLKSISLGASNGIYDSVRGAANWLRSDGTSAEQYQRSNGYLNSFDSNGFTLAEGSSTDPTYTGSYETNQSGETYVAWCWRAGGNSNTFNINGTGYSTYSALQTDNTSLPAITSGMIEPSGMSINTDAGFSIVKYVGNTTSGATIPHGLSKRPDLIFFKNTNTSNNWIVYNFLTTDSQFILKLDLTDQGNSAANTASWYANNSYFKVEQYNDTNGSGPIIAYCWHSVEGYSKFGSYTGNGSPDGTFVYTGFRPAFVLYKQTSGTGGWSIFDSERESYNQVIRSLAADSSSGEITSGRASDFLSNGFKWRNSIYGNSNNQKYIYMAFAEQPFNYANAR